MNESAEEHLYRSVVMTSVSRFKAADRLKRHSELGMWSISALSFALIVSSVMTLGGGALAETFIKLQIISSFMALMLSIATSGYRFGTRSEKMHECGIELNALARLIEKELSKSNKEAQEGVIDELREKYEAVLRSHENHNSNDFRRAKYHRFSADYKLGKHWFWLYWLEYQIKFAHYYLIIAAALFWIVTILFK